MLPSLSFLFSHTLVSNRFFLERVKQGSRVEGLGLRWTSYICAIQMYWVEQHFQFERRKKKCKEWVMAWARVERAISAVTKDYKNNGMQRHTTCYKPFSSCRYTSHIMALDSIFNLREKKGAQDRTYGLGPSWTSYVCSIHATRSRRMKCRCTLRATKPFPCSFSTFNTFTFSFEKTLSEKQGVG